MSDRITKTDVSNAFGWMVKAANDCGLDTAGWSMETGGGGFNYALNLGKYGTRNSFGAIGKTAAAAYDELRVMEHAFRMVSGQAAGPPPAWWGRSLP